MTEWHLDPAAREIARGGALYYPASGPDWFLPVAMFGDVVSDLWLVDIAYFSRRGRPMTHVAPLLGRREPTWEFLEAQLEGPPLALPETRIAEGGRTIPHLEPGTRSERYRHRLTGHELTIHRRRGYGQVSIERVRDMRVFFHRGDSPGEGGSGIAWLSGRWHPLLAQHLGLPGLVVSDGSMANPPVLKALAERNEDPDEVARAARPFEAYGWRWECVGWASPRRTAATLVWKVEPAEAAEGGPSVEGEDR